VLVFSRWQEVCEALGARRSALTIGVFDGLHRGHLELIGRTVARARKRSAVSIVITFSDHPLALLAPPYCPKRLIYADRKQDLLRKGGVDILLELKFTRELSQFPPERFVSEVVVENCRAAVVVCGYDFSFGRQGAGNVQLLREAGLANGFELEVVDPHTHAGSLVKSTHVRETLYQGDVAQAAQLLTRPYELRGTVGTGFQRGRTIGFPTANVEPDHRHLVPGHGVYFCYARIRGETASHPAMVNIGVKPTFESESATIEAHLLDWSGELVGRELELHFITRLRDEQKFDGLDALVRQLEQDRANSRALHSQQSLDSLRSS